MFTQCCRILVLDKDSIEDKIKKCFKENIFIESCFYKVGAFIKAVSDDLDTLDSFFVQLKEETDFFFLKNNEIDNYALSAEDITGNLLEKKNLRAVTAESCTGGLIAKKLTDRPGSSVYFWGSFVTYDNSAKLLLGVRDETLQTNGAVSSETVSEMADCALEKSGADIAVSVSGVAGPGGGSAEKPVGTVWFGFKDSEKAGQLKLLFRGSREEVREKASETALLIIIKSLLENAGVDSMICGDYIKSKI